MKVVVSNTYYVQVRDLLFIGNLYKSNMIVDYYLSLINKGCTDTEFVNITNHTIIKLLNNDIIIDFSDFQDSSMTYLSNYLKNLYLSGTAKKEIVNHQADDIRDIMALKKGELHYAIPLIPTDEISINDENLGVSFRSTIFNNYFILQGMNIDQVCDITYSSFVTKVTNIVKMTRYKGMDEVSYEIIDKGSYLVIKFNEGKKKRQSLKDILSKKFKKGS